ncbi:MAG: hypothetical protein JW806_06075 [Sedimentisphaerales bacterium]|nr:hypothetical protein [Sedimentisphaerales bacterium]
MKKAFTITELVVAVGLLAVVMSISSVVFSYSIDAQRTAKATSEIMRTLRAITDQLDITLGGIRKDGYLILCGSGTSPGANDSLYFFSTGSFHSWYGPSPSSSNRSNIARIYFGPSDIAGDVALDAVLFTPSNPGIDHMDCSYSDCQANLLTSDCIDGGTNPLAVVFNSRPSTDINSPSDGGDPNNVRRILAQNVYDIRIEWTRKAWWPLGSTQIPWFSLPKPSAAVSPGFSEAIGPPGPPYLAMWSPLSGNWPDAFKFTFTIYDSRGILENGRQFEHIVYIGN